MTLKCRLYMQRTCRTESLMSLSIYLQFTTNLIVVSFFASSWLSATHLYVPLSSLLQLGMCNICFSFPVPLFCLCPLNHVTRAGGLPPGPAHRHEMSSPTFNVQEREHSTVSIGVTEIEESHFVAL